MRIHKILNEDEIYFILIYFDNEDVVVRMFVMAFGASCAVCEFGATKDG